MGLLAICKKFGHFFGSVGYNLVISFIFMILHCSYMLYSEVSTLLVTHFSICKMVIFQVRLRDYGVLDFDATDVRRQPPVDTTWQQVLAFLPIIPMVLS